MKKIMFVCLVVIGSVFAVDFYKLENVKKVEDNLYRSGDLYLVTKYCYHYTYGEDAVLKWEQYSYDNKIIWEDGTTCECEKIFKVK